MDSLWTLVSRLCLLGALVQANTFLPRAVNLLCAPDTCVPIEVKQTLKNCWPEEGKKAWTTCLATNANTCSVQDANKITDCLVREVYNMTDLKVQYHRDLRFKMFYSKALLVCAGDKINLNMVVCSLPSAPNRNWQKEVVEEA